MHYLHYDVFTDTPFEGNQLAVFPDPPRDVAAELMQRIAGEMNFSESTFIFPPNAGGGAHMRIFTPAAELPMAGHPTIGSTFALADEGAIPAGQEQFVFELGVGPIPVDLEWKDGALRFAWMTQLEPKFGREIAQRDAFARAVGVEPGALADLPIQEVSCGVPFLFVPLKARAAVDGVAIDRRALGRVFADAGCEEFATFFFTPDRTGAAGDETVYSRMLAPQFGIVEDPATGGASGPLGSYLLHYGMVSAQQARAMVSLQGAAMRRPSRIHMAIDSENGRITRVRVGGTSVRVGEGKIRVP